MGQNHNWFEHVRIGNADRREKDKNRKRQFSGAGNESIPLRVSTYHRINRAIYKVLNWGGHQVKYYRLPDIAAIYGLSPKTIRRWYATGMLPEPCSYEGQRQVPLYIKPQVLVICRVLDNIYMQGITQFRQSHTSHIAMMREGCRIAVERFYIKLATEPRKPLRILPRPSEWARLRAVGKAYTLSTDYNPIPTYENPRFIMRV